MKNQLKAHPVYFILYAIFIVSSGIVLSLSNKESIHLFFNGYHNSISDFIFKYATNIGDGLALVVVSVMLLFVSKRMTLQVALSGIISGFIAQFLKKVVFGATPRPSAFFKNLGVDLYYVPDVELHEAFSFPSGHSTAIFALITSLVFIQKSKNFDVLFFAFATLVAYSRIYLSQHFLSDILFGSFIGTSVALLVNLWLYSPKLLVFKNLDDSLINFSTKKT